MQKILESTEKLEAKNDVIHTKFDQKRWLKESLCSLKYHYRLGGKDFFAVFGQQTIWNNFEFDISYNMVQSSTRTHTFYFLSLKTEDKNKSFR